MKQGSRILLMNLFEPYMTPINLRDEKIRSSFAEAETELTRVLAVLGWQYYLCNLFF